MDPWKPKEFFIDPHHLNSWVQHVRFQHQKVIHFDWTSAQSWEFLADFWVQLDPKEFWNVTTVPRFQTPGKQKNTPWKFQQFAPWSSTTGPQVRKPDRQLVNPNGYHEFQGRATLNFQGGCFTHMPKKYIIWAMKRPWLFKGYVGNYTTQLYPKYIWGDKVPTKQPVFHWKYPKLFFVAYVNSFFHLPSFPTCSKRKTGRQQFSCESLCPLGIFFLFHHEQWLLSQKQDKTWATKETLVGKVL